MGHQFAELQTQNSTWKVEIHVLIVIEELGRV
jgi:hypothetical protein